MTKDKEHQVSEQEVIASFWGSLIHPDVEIRRIDPQTFLILNKRTGATLTITAKAVQLEHTYAHAFFRGHECAGCNWEWITSPEWTDSPPVKLSVLKGNRL